MLVSSQITYCLCKCTSQISYISYIVSVCRVLARAGVRLWITDGHSVFCVDSRQQTAHISKLSGARTMSWSLVFTAAGAGAGAGDGSVAYSIVSTPLSPLSHPCPSRLA